MNNLIIWIKVIFSVSVAILEKLFGGFDVIFKTLVICMTLDYITGVLSAIYQKKLNSKTGFKGIIKKASILMVVALSSVIGVYSGLVEIRSMVMGFYIANEGISILENAVATDIPVMGKLKKILEKIEEENK